MSILITEEEYGFVPLSMTLLDLGMGLLANFHVWYYVVVKSSFKHARGECEESKRTYVF